jgi:glycine betaine catabolism A
MLPLPADVYLSETSHARDQLLLSQHWTCIGRVEDVALPGAWMRGANRLCVVRGEDLELRAMFDVCRHRASTILEGESGRIARFVCPYHGWSYDLTGRGKECDGLMRAHVATWGGFVFVSRNDAPFVAPEFVQGDLESLRVGHRARWEVSANWKLLVQNFQESHHFPSVHPGLERHTPFARSSSIVTDGPWLGGRMELVSETVSLDGKRNGRPLIAASGVVTDALLFPTSLFSVQPDYALSYRLSPLAVDRTRIDFSILFHPSVAHLEHRDVIDFWKVTNEEDRAICERQMEGLRSGVWTPLRYAESEDGVMAFDTLLRREYA